MLLELERKLRYQALLNYIYSVVSCYLFELSAEILRQITKLYFVILYLQGFHTTQTQ